MTLSSDTSVAGNPPPPPPIGSLVYLAGYLLKLRLSAEVTPPDTPNLYSGQFEVMDDHGIVDLSPLAGPQGYPGKADFPLRRQDDPTVQAPADLPINLTNTSTDIGKYWEIATVDFEGVITAVTSYIWYGTSWKTIQMGTKGPPGPAPEIQPDVVLIEPQPPPTYPDTTSAVLTSGPLIQPNWEYDLAVPAGIPGPIGPVYTMPDVDLHTIAPVSGDLFACSGNYDSEGRAIWKPLGRKAYATQFYSMPETSFAGYTGVAQRAYIGGFSVPAQPWPWTPIVWGHLGGTSTTQITASNAQQLVNVTALGGTFTLTSGGATTPPIPYNASPADIVTYLEGLATVGVNNVIGAIQGSMNTLLEFVNALAGQVIEPLIANVASLIPPSLSSVVINVLDSGGNLINQITNFLSADPLMIGCEVLLGDPTTGTIVARGLGNTMGIVNIMPHYSSAKKRAQAITPTNRYAIVPAGQVGHIYVNLWNDGALGVYSFNPQNAQLMMLVVPMEQGLTMAPF
jgi:hypothetical protein